MSFDLQIWSTQPVDLSRDLPELTEWRQIGTMWVRNGRDWQIVLGHSDRVAPEDIPEQVVLLLNLDGHWA